MTILKIISVVIAISICFFAVFPILSVGLVTGILLILLAKNIRMRNRITVFPGMMPMLLFCVVIIVSAFASEENSVGIRFSLYYTCLFLIAVLLANESGWQNSFISAMYLFVFIHGVFILWSAVSWDSFLPFAQHVLKPDVYQETYWFGTQYGGLAGITGQVGTAAVYMSIGIYITFSRLLSGYSFMMRKKRFIYGIVLVFFLACAFMTGKRSVLVLVIIALWSAYILSREKGKRAKSFFTFLAIIGGLCLALLVISRFVPAVINTFVRFAAAPEEDISSGRFERYAFAWASFKQHPLFGNGTQTIIGTHNDYLQLLASNGIVGVALFVFSCMITIRVSIPRCMRRFVENRSELMTEYRRNEVYLLLASMLIQIYFLLYAIVGSMISDYSFIFCYMMALAISMSDWVSSSQSRTSIRTE